MNNVIREDLEYIYNSNIEWNIFNGKRVLISGANGFIPSYIVETLLFLNVKASLDVFVYGLVRNKHKANIRFKEYLNNPYFKLIVQDVTEKIQIDGNIDYIIHAASQASPKFYSTDPVGTLRANVIGTINLLEFAKERNIISFLFFSSSEIYGEVSSKVDRISEVEKRGYINPMDVRSCYAESKRMGENICVSYSKQFNINIKIVRPFHTYGPKMDLNDGRVFIDFVSDILNNRNIVIKSDGSARRAYCYLSDAVIAYFLILLKGENQNAYNIGAPKNECSVLELAELLIDMFPEKKLTVSRKLRDEHDKYLASSVNRIIPNIEKVEALGWSPYFSITQGFKRTIQSYINS